MPAFRNILIAIALIATLIVLGISVTALWQKNMGQKNMGQNKVSQTPLKLRQKPPLENLDFKLVDENNQAVALTDYGTRFKLVFLALLIAQMFAPISFLLSPMRWTRHKSRHKNCSRFLSV